MSTLQAIGILVVLIIIGAFVAGAIVHTIVFAVKIGIALALIYGIYVLIHKYMTGS